MLRVYGDVVPDGVAPVRAVEQPQVRLLLVVAAVRKLPLLRKVDVTKYRPTTIACHAGIRSDVMFWMFSD